MAKFVELYCDEKDGYWKLTIWTIPTKDFDPFDCAYENYMEDEVTYAEPHIHKARNKQREVVDYLRKQGHEVFVNTSNPDSYFQVMPKWLVDLIAGVVQSSTDFGQDSV